MGTCTIYPVRSSRLFVRSFVRSFDVSLVRHRESRVALLSIPDRKAIINEDLYFVLFRPWSYSVFVDLPMTVNIVGF